MKVRPKFSETMKKVMRGLKSLKPRLERRKRKALQGKSLSLRSIYPSQIALIQISKIELFKLKLSSLSRIKQKGMIK
jgi:hypothetical protein